MNCLKCGAETEDSQVFCSKCLASMAKYPVKSDTPVQLPQRPRISEKPPVRGRGRSIADTVRSLRKLIRWLTAIIAVLSVLLCLTAGFLIYTLENQDKSSGIGRNYTTSTSDKKE